MKVIIILEDTCSSVVDVKVLRMGGGVGGAEPANVLARQLEAVMRSVNDDTMEQQLQKTAEAARCLH